MKSSTKTLKSCMRRGQLSSADLRWWFGRDYFTVREWVVNERVPRQGAHVRRTWESLDALHNAIILRKGFPIPLDLRKRERAAYIRLLGEGKLGRARLLATH